MSDPKLAHVNSVTVLSAKIQHRADPVCHSKRRQSVRIPVSFRVVAICTLFVSAACEAPVMARGGHGMVGFGVHGGHRMGAGAGEGVLTPAYVLITVSKITNAEAFKAAMSGLTATNGPFAGRPAIDADKPVAWEGTASEHIAMIQFDNPDQVEAWKNSDAFKNFDAELHRSSESTIQLVQGLPTAAAHGIGGRRGRGFNQKAFEPNVKEYDQMLKKMHGICRGC
jgi:uncharacterized protein (DUF1330 family)